MALMRPARAKVVMRLDRLQQVLQGRTRAICQIYTDIQPVAKQ